MRIENNKTKTKELLEFSAKLLSRDLGKNITPFQIYIAFQVQLLTGAPFKECVKASFEAYKSITN